MFCAAVAQAGDYHRGQTLICGECHGGDRGRLDGQASTINALCLGCHDGSTRAADVVGQNSGRYPTDVRQAGCLNELGVGAESTGHTLGSTAVAPGSSPPWSAASDGGLHCLHCHEAHGNSAYRNLRTHPGNAVDRPVLVTYNAGAPGMNDLRQQVFERRARSYDERDVDFNEPDRSNSAYAAFCAGCHDRLHGVPGDAATVGGSRSGRSFAGFARHPTAGVNIGDGQGDMAAQLATLAARRNRVKVASETGAWDPPARGATPSCMSCHKAHGNQNAFGLIYRSGRGALTEEGDGGGRALESLCGQCHGEPAAVREDQSGVPLALGR